MKRDTISVSLFSALVEYDPGDAIGAPLEMTLAEAACHWKQDMAYLQTLLDTASGCRVKKWPTIRYRGQELPDWQICQITAVSAKQPRRNKPKYRTSASSPA